MLIYIHAFFATIVLVNLLIAQMSATYTQREPNPQSPGRRAASLLPAQPTRVR